MADTGIQFRPPSAVPSPVPAGGAKSMVAVEGMTCGNCVRHVTDALQGVAGVAFAAVDLARSRATVQWKPATTPVPNTLVQVVTAAGYQARLLGPGGEAQAPGPDGTVAPTEETAPNPWRRPLWLGIPATLLLLSLDWVFGLGMNRTYHWFSFVVALPVQIVAGAGFYRGAWHQLRARSANMDTLVALGSTAAFGFSVWALFSRAVPHLFFAEAVTILTLISLGHWLESRMSERAGAALRALLELAPARARKLAPDPQSGSAAAANGLPSSTVEVDVPAATLIPGDFILLKPGDRVPVDAVVMEGVSAYDESMLTGESVPVDKGIGSRVLAGTLNASARQVARVVAIGEETALASIIAAVQRAQSSRANIQRLADRISAVFVPLVIVVAFLAAAAWLVAPEGARAFHSAMEGMLWHVHLPDSPLAAAFFVLCSVLIVACPCAMGIATPVALMAGVNAAARRGILIRDAQALEKSGIVTAVLFDKTGTLTEGRPTISNFEILRAPAEPKEILRVAAAVAAASQHPLSQAISRLDSTGSGVSAAEEARGGGVRAMAPAGFCGSPGPVRVRLGSFRWLEEEGVVVPTANGFADDALERGMTLVGFAVDGELRAQFALHDKLRADAPALVAQLRQPPLGFQVHLVSGDHQRVVDGVARDLGVDGAFAGVRPAEKAARIQELQRRGLRVAFVGDGINDAPALAQADLGIAVAQASDAAREAADIVLLRSDLKGVRTALLLARATLRTIRQNLFWAFFYNAVAVPLAAIGLLSPVVCALSMGLSDVIVIGNALRLARKKV